MEESPSRRQTLVATGAAVGSALTGCVLLNTGIVGTKLARVSITNYTDDAYTVAFRVTWEGEMVQNRSYKLEPGNPNNSPSKPAPCVVPERTWPRTRGRFTVSARLPGTNWQTVNPATDDYPQRYWISIEIVSDELMIYTTVYPEGCSVEINKTDQPPNESLADT